MKNILFLGSKQLGEMAFDYLLEHIDSNLYSIPCAGSNISCDGVWWGTNGIYKKTQESNVSIDFVSTAEKNFNVLEEKILEYQVDLILSIQHRWILPESILKMVNYQAINLHNAKLPEYRGHNAVNMAILNNESTYTSTLHWMIEEVDAGALAFERSFEIPKNILASDLYKMAQKNAMLLIGDLVFALNSGQSIPKIPMAGGGNFYPRKTLQQKLITNGEPPESAARKSRAFHFPGFEPAYFIVAGKKYYVIPETTENEDH